jgi:hypothetical protein
MYNTPGIKGFEDNEDPLDPKRKIFDALSPGGTATGPSQGVNGAPAAELPPPISASSAPPKPFQSGNRSVSGYLQDAVKDFAPTIHGIGDEAGRKSALKTYLESISPEVQARGGNLSNIRGDKATVDGRTIDFYRDIEGAADPQFLDVTDQGTPNAAGEFAPGGLTAGSAFLDPLLNGDPMAKIQEALAKMSGPRSNAEALMAALGGR